MVQKLRASAEISLKPRKHTMNIGSQKKLTVNPSKVWFLKVPRAATMTSRQYRSLEKAFAEERTGIILIA